MRRGFLALVPASCLVVACVYTIHPVVPAGGHGRLPALAGTWAGEAATLRLTIVEQADSSYLIIYTDEEGQTGRFVGRVAELGGVTVLDVTPEERDLGYGESYQSLLLPLHAVFVVRQADRELRLAQLQPDSVRAHLTRMPPASAWVDHDGTLVLTADTPILRQLIAGFATQPGFLEEAEPLRRLAPGRGR